MTYFLTEAELKRLTPTADGIKDGDIAPALRLVQETQVLPDLGKELYDELQAQVAASTVTAPNLELLAVIKPYMAWATYRELKQMVWSRTVTAGVTHTNASQYSQVSKNTLDWADQDLRAKASQYRERLLEFLNEKCNDYPLYRPDVKPARGLPWFRTI